MAPGPRDDQVMADALCAFIISGTMPPKSLVPMAKRHMKGWNSVGPTNLVHMGHALYYILKQPGAEAQLSERVYRPNREGVFRSTFEGLSVGYSGYQSLAWLAILKCSWAPSSLRAEARAQLRIDLTIQALCSTLHGRVAISCGRVYSADGRGVIDVCADYRVRAVRGISDDGWWPPRGVGPKFWSSTSSVSARPWRSDRNLPKLLFDEPERAALDIWARQHVVVDELRRLIAPIRVAQGLTIADTLGGSAGEISHIAWMSDIRSYGAGKNTAQPIVWALRDEVRGALIADPPTGARLTPSGEFVVDGEVVDGFPIPGAPKIWFSSAPPEIIG